MVVFCFRLTCYFGLGQCFPLSFWVIDEDGEEVSMLLSPNHPSISRVVIVADSWFAADLWVACFGVIALGAPPPVPWFEKLQFRRRSPRCWRR